MAIFITIGYNNFIQQKGYDLEELDGTLPTGFLAGPYASNEDSWKDCKLLAYLLAEDDKEDFIYALLYINGVLGSKKEEL